MFKNLHPFIYILITIQLLMFAFLSTVCAAITLGGNGNVEKTEARSFIVDWKKHSFRVPRSVYFIDRNKGWAVGVGGSILATSDGGRNWVPQKSGTSAQLLSVHFVNQEKGWAVGSVGTVLATTDGGKKWIRQKNEISALLFSVYFIDGKKGWAVGENGMILTTKNGGNVWIQQKADFDKTLYCVHFANENNGWVVGKEGAVLATEDGGNNWIRQENMTREHLQSVHFVDEEKGWIVGNKGVILGTIDGGKTWTQRESKTTTSFYSVYFLNEEKGWVVGLLGTILMTDDGGKSWTPQKSGVDGPLLSVCFSDQNHGWLVDMHGTVLSTADSGGTWDTQICATKNFLGSVYFVSKDNGWVVGQHGIILVTNDEGQTWSPQRSNTTEWLTGIEFVDHRMGWVVGGKGTILMTRNGGKTWASQISGIKEGITSVHFVDKNRGWVVGYKGTILVTRNSGKTWIPQTSGTIENLNSVYFVNQNIGWIVGNRGTILTTIDGGTVWNKQISHTEEHLVSVHFPYPETGWAVGKQGTILASFDSGVTWESQTGGTKHSLYSVYFANEKTGWAVGQEGSLLTTNDSGKTWSSQKSLTRHGIHSVQFVDGKIGWAVGAEGTLIKGIRSQNVPYFENDPDVSIDGKDIRINWTVECENPDTVTSVVKFRQRETEQWRRVKATPTRNGKSYSLIWRPTTSDDLLEGEPIHFLITVEAETGRDDIKKLFASHVLAEKPVWRPLPVHWTAWFCIIVISYCLFCGLLWVFRPILFLWLHKNVPLEEFACVTYVGPVFRPFARIATRVFGWRFFAKTARTRKAWCAVFRNGVVNIGDLHPEILKNYVLYDDCRRAWLHRFRDDDCGRLDSLPDIARTEFLKHDDILDTWIDKHIAIARKGFAENETYQGRKHYVPVPVTLGSVKFTNLSPKDLIAQYDRTRSWCVFITGEGGLGKTSLSCQIALWGMAEDPAMRLVSSHLLIPVLLEPGVNLGDDLDDFVNLLQGFTQSLIRLPEPIENDLFLHLLRKKRILVIIDGLSEMESVGGFNPLNKGFPVGALVVTSRKDELHKLPNKIMITPMKVNGKQLSSFIDAYLTQKDVREYFTDKDFFDACRDLSIMVGERRDITPLFAKLYIEQLVNIKNGIDDDSLPDSIPSLMLQYVKTLNNAVIDGKFDNVLIHKVLKIVAWECLKRSYRPGWGLREGIMTSLRGFDDAWRILKYLEVRLRIIRIFGASDEKIRFELDPLAEYFAALYLVERHRNNDDLWKEFFCDADTKPGSPKAIRGFLLAVKDCYLFYSRYLDTDISGSIVEDLNKRIEVEQ